MTLRQLLLPRWIRSGRVAIGLLVVLSLLAVSAAGPALAPHAPGEQDLAMTLRPMDLRSTFPLGTDALGRCVLSRLLHGAQQAAAVALAASLGAMLLGSALAYAAGYLGGRTDWLISRAVDVSVSFPPVVLALILAVGLGTGSTGVVPAIVLVDWTRFCRAVRAEVLAVARRDHVAAARLLGLTRWQALWREVVPATLPLLAALLALEMGIAVVVEAALSFLGLGVAADQVSWGRMIADGRDVLHLAPASLLAPAAAIVVSVAGFNLLGDGLRRTLDLRLPEGRPLEDRL